MPRQRRISRRRLAQGAGGVLAASALLPAVRMANASDRTSNVSEPNVESTPVGTEPTVEPVQATDLTVRWLNVTPRVERANLIGAWPCDEGTGYVFNDVSGHGHTFHITGSEWNQTDSGLTGAFRRKGRRGGGLHLNGTRWLWTPPADDLNIRPRLSITAWVRPERLPASAPARLLARRGLYGLDLTPDGRLKFSVRAEDGTPFHVTTGPDTVPHGRWTHVAGTSDAATGKLRVYLNGVEANSVTVDPFTPATSAEEGLLAGLRLDGDLDEITLHNTPIDAATVRNLYLVGLPKLYAQTRETIDPGREVWTRYKGSEPIPHPIQSDSVFTARFDASTRTEQGQQPTGPTAATFVPGEFGAALDVSQNAVEYPSPLSDGDGTVTAWVLPVADDSDPDRQARKVVFRASGQNGKLTLGTEAGRWRLTVERDGGTSTTIEGPPQTFLPDVPEHVAATWGEHDSGERAISLYVNGVQVANQTIGDIDTVYDGQVVIGGTADAPAYVLVDDLTIANQVRGWGSVCPRGHVSTEAAGLDLRDGFDRPDGTAPVLWSGADGGQWTYRTRDWVDTSGTGDDPDRRRSLFQATASGLHAAYHPDAYGHASSIEAGVSFLAKVDGWAGVFVQSSGPGSAFDGHVLSINPATNQLRLARYVDGAVVDAKRLPYDFTISAKTTYELTLTSSGDGVLRGFVDGNNMISMRMDPTASTEGYAGLYTSDAQACFDDAHFTALTPAAEHSRLVQTQVFGTVGDVGYDRLTLTPFRWHKRPGLPPDQYVRKEPEHPGNIAGADTSVPVRPIPPAYWRAEDSANSDLATVDGRVVFFMRGNYQDENGESAGSHIGVLDTTTDRFDGVHFDDPSQSTDLDECKLLRGRIDRSPPEMRVHERFGLNDEASAYVGDGNLVVFVKETRSKDGYPQYRRLAFDYYNLHENDWRYRVARYVDWSEMDPTDPHAKFHGIEGTPELVSLRDPDTDAYTALLYHRAETAEGHQVMGITGLRMDADGKPLLDRRWPTVRSISRLKYKKKAIYSFRVLFDNGIYYLHYAEGERVPDWPTHFVLGATLDPYTGPWMVNPDTDGEPNQPGYFRRGGTYAPDNGAIWQGTMFKHRGRYYMYYENFHAVEDNDRPYQHYDRRHTGSRVGFATGN